MLTEESILKCITRNITEQGELPENFQLPKADPDEDEGIPILFADGAMDGMAMYHIASHSASEETLEDFREALRLASSGEMEKAEAALSRAGGRDSAISTMGELLGMVVDNQDQLDAEGLSRFAIRLMLESDDRECVKYGISLMAVFTDIEQDEDIRSLLRILALSDEFTYFVLFVMKRWEDRNEAIFDVAQRVHGWGRIHAVEILEPQTEEIREWLMTEGFRNHVMEQYSALTCLEKSGVMERVKGELTAEEFTAVGDLITALLEEEPVGGICQVRDAVGFVMNYMDRSEERELSAADYRNLKTLQDYCGERMRGWSEVYDRCEAVLHTAGAQDTVRQALAAGDWSVIRLAQQIGVRYEEFLLEAMRADFDENYSLCRYCDDEKWAEEILEIFHEKMPPEAIGAYTKEVTFMGQTFLDNLPLSNLYDYLECAPGKGIEYVRAGLESEAKFCRKGAVDLLQSWAYSTGMPLIDLSEELYEAVREAAERESHGDMDLAQKMWTLVEGEAPSDNAGESGETDGLTWTFYDADDQD